MPGKKTPPRGSPLPVCGKDGGRTRLQAPCSPAPLAMQTQCLFVEETFFFRAASIS